MHTAEVRLLPVDRADMGTCLWNAYYRRSGTTTKQSQPCATRLDGASKTIVIGSSKRETIVDTTFCNIALNQEA
jgi:hypothetical protein